MGEFLKGQEKQRYSETGHWSMPLRRFTVDGADPEIAKADFVEA
jgi:hypothetical protein